jgi:hypothetical protein
MKIRIDRTTTPKEFQAIHSNPVSTTRNYQQRSNSNKILNLPTKPQSRNAPHAIRAMTQTRDDKIDFRRQDEIVCVQRIDFIR